MRLTKLLITLFLGLKNYTYIYSNQLTPIDYENRKILSISDHE